MSDYSDGSAQIYGRVQRRKRAKQPALKEERQ